MRSEAERYARAHSCRDGRTSATSPMAPAYAAPEARRLRRPGSATAGAIGLVNPAQSYTRLKLGDQSLHKKLDTSGWTRIEFHEVEGFNESSFVVTSQRKPECSTDLDHPQRVQPCYSPSQPRLGDSHRIVKVHGAIRLHSILFA